VDYVTALGDDALVLAQRLGEWLTRAPELEEDVALANLGLDLLGQARSLLELAGRLEGAGRDADDLAYLRDTRAYRNVTLVELDNGDFAASMARLLVFATYQRELYERLSAGSEPTLAAIAAKAVKEVDYHRDHATEWVLRLGDGTAESHRRMQAGLEHVWPYVEELFTGTDRYGSWPHPRVVAAGQAVDPALLREPALSYVGAVIERATLTVPAPTRRVTGGRHGIHTDALGLLLAELQHVHRAYPGGRW
jgi:ring-1,2-phenylacetyl-CoA epoxidase subunit PaaC